MMSLMVTIMSLGTLLVAMRPTCRSLCGGGIWNGRDHWRRIHIMGGHLMTWR
jgi:hypothetical protein